MTPSFTLLVPALKLPTISGRVRHWLASIQDKVRRPPVRAQLARHASLWIDGVVGTDVVCETGSVWLTIDGQQRDVILEAGQAFQCGSGERICIHALSVAQVRVGAA